MEEDTTAPPPTLEALARDVAELRRSLAAEVRTRSLVVEDEHGIARVRTVINDDVTVLWVDAPTTTPGDDPDPDSSISLMATCGQVDHDAPALTAGLTVWVAGTPSYPM